MKEILSKIGVTLFKIILLLILIAFLAKTHNMPAAVPKKYVEKIIEITDRVLIALNLITDKRIIAKYRRKKQVQKKNNLQSNIEYDFSEYKSNAFLDWLLYNGYNIEKEDEFFNVYNRLETSINKKESELNSLANSSLLINYFEKKSLNINDNRFLHLFELTIKNLDYIKSVVLLDKNSSFSYRMGLDIISIKKLKAINKNFILSKENALYYIYRKYNSGYKYYIFFIVDLEKFFYNTGSNIFILNKNSKIIYSKNKNSELLRIVEENIDNNGFVFNNIGYKIKKLYLNKLEVYVVMIYKKYSFFKFLLNILKILFILGAIYVIYIYGKNFYKKFKELKKLKKDDELTIVSETMEEISKSIRLATESTERIIEEYSKKDNDRDYKEIYKMIEKKLSEAERITKEEKREDEWKVIEPY